MITCGRATCPAEQAMQGHKRASEILVKVLFHDVERHRAFERLQAIEKEYGKEYADALRSSLKTYQEVRRKPIEGVAQDRRYKAPKETAG